MDKVKKIPFDQYQRYGVACRAIESLRKNGESLTILEVGANTHKLLGRLLPNDNIVYLDRELPEEMQKQEEMILGDATNLNLPDASFDVVVALDVFEHIPETLREAFLTHTCRVARLLTIIGAPFDSSLTVQAEQDASNYWSSLFSFPYRWLAEHAEHGLPNLSLSKEIVTSFGFYLHTLNHGEVKLWTDLLKGHFAKESVTALAPMVSLLDQYYQDCLFLQDFSHQDTYRQFLLCSRDSNVVASVKAFFDELKVKSTESDGSYILDILKLLPLIATDINNQIVNLNLEVAKRDAIIMSITSSRSWKITRPLRFLSRLFRQCLKSLTII
jgi:SAM-dependent methyltransferase